jgi:hypothetical protein
LYSFGAQLGSEKACAGDVSSRPGKAGNKARRYGIADRDHDDRNTPGGFLGYTGNLGSRRQDDVHIGGDEIGNESVQAVQLPVRITKLQRNVFAINPAPFPEGSQERGDPSLRLRLALDVG